MTLKTYLKNNVFRHELVQAFKSSWFALMTLFIWFIIGVPVSIYYKLNSYNNEMPINKLLKYRIFHPNMFIFILLFIGVIILSIRTGHILFKYLFKKKSINIYFSLGISRNKVFWSRYLVGFIGIILCVAIPFVISFFINLNIFGYSNDLIKATLYLTFGFITIGLISYSISVVVCSLIGTRFEHILFSLGTVLFPTIVLYIIDSLSKIFLFGNSSAGAIDSNYNGSIGTLVSKFYSFNPILFILKHYYGDSSISELNIDKSLPDINYIPIIVFFIISIILSIFANILYRNYKAEKSEVLGTSKIMNFLFTFTLGALIFSLTSLLLHKSTQINNFFIILLSFVSFIIIYMAIEFFFKRKFKIIFIDLKWLLLHVAILIVIVLTLITGGFGYSSYVPSVQDIKTASISYIGNSNYIMPSNGGGQDPIYYNYSYMLDIDTMNDFKIATQLHKEIIGKGKNKSVSTYNENSAPDSVVDVAVTIKYTLKNNKKIYRNYDSLDLKTIESFLRLDNTDAFKKVLLTTLKENINAREIYVSNSYFSNYKKLETNDELKGELVESLYTDIINQSIEDGYFGNDEILGIITLSDIYSNNPYDIFARKSYYITNKFSSTINFLKKNNLFEIFNSKPVVEEISVAKSSSIFISDAGWDYLPDSKYFNIGADNNEYNDPNFISLDHNKINELLPLIKPSYFMTRGGYVAKMKIKNESGDKKSEFMNIYQFLPYKLTPNYIKEILK